jgi:hypothetical protein
LGFLNIALKGAAGATGGSALYGTYEGIKRLVQ